MAGIAQELSVRASHHTPLNRSILSTEPTLQVSNSKQKPWHECLTKHTNTTLNMLERAHVHLEEFKAFKHQQNVIC